MKMFCYLLVIALTLLAVGLQIAYLPQLPARVASHFDQHGQPNGFMAKGAFFCLMVALNVGLTALLAGVAAFSRYLPDSMINMPNKSYWLAPERRSESLAFNEITLLYIAIATCGLMIWLGHLTYIANVRGGDLPGIGLGIGIYLVVVGILCARMMWKFLAIPSTEQAS